MPYTLYILLSPALYTEILVVMVELVVLSRYYGGSFGGGLVATWRYGGILPFTLRHR